ncbi:MAG: hypothetical protein ACKV0T_27030 [Planctomycetales bacterium]
MLAFRAIVGIAVTMSLGCLPHTESPPAATSAADPPAASAPASAAMPSTVAPVAPPEVAAPPAPAALAVPAEPAPASEPPAAAPPAAPATQQVAAKAGVGLKGQSLQQESGMIVSAAKAFFNVQQKAVFDIQIPEALKLFKATEGRAPQSHDEFMAKIVAANLIKLPQLPAGQNYVYDPQREELMVEKPAK